VSGKAGGVYVREILEEAIGLLEKGQDFAPATIVEQTGSAPRNASVRMVVRKAVSLIFGAGHVGRSLVPVLSFVEFRTVVLDDRQEFASRKWTQDETDGSLSLGRSSPLYRAS
jgi:xanthine/CO dehydrogenase XdhC/CoxF family maturation factor